MTVAENSRDGNMPRVSVLIPTYNRAQFIPRAIESVLSQDFDDLELIVVDDGSTDNTADVILEIAARDPRVCYRKLPRNRGVGFARETGLRQARGSYIAWIDSDDCWLPGKLNSQISVMDLHPEIDILFGDFWNDNHLKSARDRFFAQSSTAISLLHSRSIDDNLFIVERGMKRALLADSIVHLQTVLFKTSLLDRTGGFDMALRSAEDLEFFFRAGLHHAVFAFLDHPLAERHKYQDSITADGLFSWNEKLRALTRCEHWAGRAGRHDLLPFVRKAKQRAIRNLVWGYGMRGERLRVVGMARANFQAGFSLYTFGHVCLAMLGPRALNWFEYRRSAQRRRKG